MKKLMTITAGLLLSGAALANTVTLHSTTNLSSAAYTTKSAAFDAGYDIAEALAASDQKQLRKQLRVFSNDWVDDINVVNTEITTEEFAHSRGDIQYRALVNVSYQFDTTDND